MTYHITNYFSCFSVKEELEKQQPNPLRQLFSLRNLERNIIGETWYFLLIFLVLYYIIQIAFQLDWFCVVDDIGVNYEKKLNCSLLGDLHEYG